MRRKIGLSGAHGTGKSTLIQAILNLGRNDVYVTPEAPRVLAHQTGRPDYFIRANNTLTRQMLIFLKHLQQESCAEGKVLLTDRTLVDHMAYTRVLHSQSEEYKDIEPILMHFVGDHCKTFDTILYIPIEFELQGDDVRESDADFQREIDSTMKDLYREFGVHLNYLSGSVEDRMKVLLGRMGEKHDTA